MFHRYMSCFGRYEISWSARSGLVGSVAFPPSILSYPPIRVIKPLTH